MGNTIARIVRAAGFDTGHALPAEEIFRESGVVRYRRLSGWEGLRGYRVFRRIDFQISSGV